MGGTKGSVGHSPHTERSHGQKKGVVYSHRAHFLCLPFFARMESRSWTKYNSISLTSESLQLCGLTVTEIQDAPCKQQTVHATCKDILGVRSPDLAAASEPCLPSPSTNPHSPASPRGDANNLHALRAAEGTLFALQGRDETRLCSDPPKLDKQFQPCPWT